MSVLTTPHGSTLGATIEDIQWKVDVVMSSLSEVDQVAVPIAVIRIQLSNGVVLTYRLRQEDLHQWRFSMAKVLRDLVYLEKKQPPSHTKRNK